MEKNLLELYFFTVHFCENPSFLMLDWEGFTLAVVDNFCYTIKRFGKTEGICFF